MKTVVGLLGASFLLFASALLHSQDLAEAAKKERERRAAFKDKPVALLTNDTMSGITKKPAVSLTGDAAPAAGEEPLPAAGERTPLDEPVSPRRTVPSVTVIQPTERAGAPEGVDADAQAADPEARWQKAKEYADLLELKLNALWLQFYSMDDGMRRDLLQQEIADVFEKYTRAREEETRLGESLGIKRDEDR